jgi:uncharacterized protein (DUF2147 family)
MKQLLFIFSLFIGLLFAFASPPEDGSRNHVTGIWLSENKKQKIIVSYDSTSKFYIGKIVWMYEDEQTAGRTMLDSKNPNKKLQTRRLTGITLIYNLKLIGKDRFKGMIYDPNTGKDYKCNLTLRPDKRSVEIRAYFVVPIIGKTEIATKID